MFTFLYRFAVNASKLLATMFLTVMLAILLSVTLVVWLLNVYAFVFYDSAGKDYFFHSGYSGVCRSYASSCRGATLSLTFTVCL